MRNNIYIIIFFSLFLGTINGQAQQNLNWWNPQASAVYAIEGQAWQDGLESFYDRLPLRAKSQVRKEVWDRSKFSSGLTIRFRTSSPTISVRYKVAGRLTLPTMAAVGASGVDLYAVSQEGKHLWCRPAISFGDTISYTYAGLKPSADYAENGYEYRLFLPPYNSVVFMEIGVVKNQQFMPLSPRTELPIVVYGTSITQGGCATRPGMTWASILQRKLNMPLINLGFSGNGQLEPEVIRLINEIEASVYVLDCLPNLTSTKLFDDKKLEAIIMNAVKDIRQKHPKTPILLTDHDGYSSGEAQPRYKNYYTRVNEVMDVAFAKLKKDKIENIYHLNYEEIDQDEDGKVDGTHPSDLGMKQIATAYENIIRKMLNKK